MGDFTSQLVAGMREDLDALSERVEHRDGNGDTEELLAVRVGPGARATVRGLRGQLGFWDFGIGNG